jgi:hypothetical protein
VCLPPCGINSTRRFPSALCLQNLELYCFLTIASCRSPEILKQADNHDKIEENSRSGFRCRRRDDRQYDQDVVFSHYKGSNCRERAKEQRYINYNFIYSRGNNLRPINKEFFWHGGFFSTQGRTLFLIILFKKALLSKVRVSSRAFEDVRCM